MARVGIDKESGRLLYGWDHCVQSIMELITTEIGERLQRRLLGGRSVSMIDKPQNEENVIDLYVSVYEAIQPRIVEGRQYGEPGFVLLRCSLDASTPGRVILLLSGVYFENGHLGDYSNPIQQTLTFAVTSLGEGVNLRVI